MKFFPAAAQCLLVLAVSAAQNPPQAPQPPASPSQPASQQPAQPAPSGKVIFSRSTDENGQTTTEASPETKLAKAPVSTDEERQAVTFTAYDLDVHLRPAEHQIAARAQLTARNDGKTPLARIPLEISSTLNWERIRVADKDAAFEVATLNSDSDHTGQLHEAAIALSSPLAPGATIALDVTYSGIIEPSAQRLISVGAPEDAALHSDWDRIDTEFTGLRGFGNVAWYPISAPPVILGDGSRLFDEIGDQKSRMAPARFHLRLTAEFPHGQAPTIALINGHPVPLAVTDTETSGIEVSGVATAESQAAPLGFEAPSLFVAIRTLHPGANLTAFTRAEDDAWASSWTLAETPVTAFLQQWLGDKPRTQLTVLDLPDPNDAPYETGPLLVTAIKDADPEQLKFTLAHALTHVWLQSPQAPPQQAWLSEGIPYFVGTLWTEQQYGRARALEMLEGGRSALALAEPESPGQSPGQPLSSASTPAYYRTKAAYVFWMLRDIAGDDALSAALRTGPQSAADFEAALQKSAKSDLHWFFADWVDADRGLPDLSIESLFTSPQQGDNWLTAVHLSNSGYAGVDVPVIVRTDTISITQRVQIPAHGKTIARIPIHGRPVEVRVNDGSVPETNATVHVTKVGPASTSDSAKP
ncbi:M1 aminopeptidase family protein [Terracidiphilus gabretensis]|jgi:hypothetical protein|uniref:hypothetical protein n=1 Tax=Terracidiphilus gabretensis TaxID=1577687 RepID=UPI00071B67D3|nr:hypothetical protein [Terracidiphilus gabretensis]